MLLWSVASEDLAVDISSVEVVPFLLVPMYIHSRQAYLSIILPISLKQVVNKIKNVSWNI